MDRERLLGDKKKSFLNKEIKAFEKKFPQFRIALHVTRLPKDLDVRMLGYWLLNFCPFAEGESAEMREGTLLFVIDCMNRQAGLTVGYRLDPFLSDDKGTRLLAEAREDFQSGDYVAGMRVILAGIRGHLSRQCAVVEEIAKSYLRAPKPDLKASR